MNDNFTELVESDDYKEAVALHCKVMASKEQVVVAMCSFAMNLKAMRDGKLYTQLRYNSFDDYIEQEVHIKKRQVYHYISVYETLGGDILQSNAHLGITKLVEILEVPDVERAGFIADNDLEGMSVKEIKALIEQSKQQVEQISLLNTTVENQKAEIEQVNFEERDKEQLQEDLDRFIAEKERLERELIKIKSKPIDVAVVEPSSADIAKIKADAEKAIKADYEAKQKQVIKDATEKAVSKAEKDMQKKIDDAKAQAAADTAEQYKKSISAMEHEKALAVEKADKLAKDLKVAVDGDMTTIQFYLDELGSVFGKITQKVIEIKKQDADKAKKLFCAVDRILDSLKEQVGEV